MIRFILFFSFCLSPFISFSQEKDTVFSPCVTEIFVPNSFSGNGDSVNDYFIPRMVGNPDTYEFQIFNRWGELIFVTKKVTEGWNGSNKDNSSPGGTYYWIINIKCLGSDEKYSLTGYVNLIR